MAKITALPAANDLDGTEQVPIVKDGTTQKTAHTPLVSAVARPFVDQAEAAASLAESAAGPTYATIAEGLAATASGMSFAVALGDGDVAVYLNDAGTALHQRTMATTTALAKGTGADKLGYQQPEPEAIVLPASMKLRRLLIMPEEFGAVGDGIANDTSAMARARNAAQARGAQAVLWLSGDYLVDSFDNPRGIVTQGPGRIVKAIAGGVLQLNSYADYRGRIVLGREYIHRIFQRMELGPSGASGRIDINLFGDSTVANGYMSMSTIDILTRLFQARGMGNVAFSNYGVAGSQIGEMDAIPHILGQSKDASIIKYGINDGVNPKHSRLDTFETELRSKLQEIRDLPEGRVSNHTIILVGPNCTANTEYGRDELWYEQLDGVFVRAARDFQCAYINVYAAFRDARGGAGLWLDDLGGGDGVHPRNSLGIKIWSLVADTIISASEAVWFGTSNILNVTSASYAPVASAKPSEWPYGIVHARATLANGFPIDGFVISERNPDGGCIQRLYPFNLYNTRALIRTGHPQLDVFNRWSGAPEGINLTNGWSSFNAVFGYPSATIDGTGFVHVNAMITGGTTGVGDIVASLPLGLAPANDCIFLCPTNSGFVQIKVERSGLILQQSAGDAAWMSLAFAFLAA